MSLKDQMKWARPEHVWTDLYTGQDPRCIRVIPVAAMRAWLEGKAARQATLSDERIGVYQEILAELEGL